MPYTAGTNPRRKRDLEWLERVRREGLPAFDIPDEGPDPPPTLGVAVQQFNNGQFFECHETLEALWLDEGYPLRLFYQGVLKVAVGLYHARRGNNRGAHSLLSGGVELLKPFLPEFMGLDTASLYHEAQEWRRHVKQPPGAQTSPPPLPQLHLACR